MFDAIFSTECLTKSPQTQTAWAGDSRYALVHRLSATHASFAGNFNMVPGRHWDLGFNYFRYMLGGLTHKRGETSGLFMVFFPIRIYIYIKTHWRYWSINKIAVPQTIGLANERDDTWSAILRPSHILSIRN